MYLSDLPGCPTVTGPRGLVLGPRHHSNSQQSISRSYPPDIWCYDQSVVLPWQVVRPTTTHNYSVSQAYSGSQFNLAYYMIDCLYEVMIERGIA